MIGRVHRVRSQSSRLMAQRQCRRINMVAESRAAAAEFWTKLILTHGKGRGEISCVSRQHSELVRFPSLVHCGQLSSGSGVRAPKPPGPRVPQYPPNQSLRLSFFVVRAHAPLACVRNDGSLSLSRWFFRYLNSSLARAPPFPYPLSILLFLRRGFFTFSPLGRIEIYKMWTPGPRATETEISYCPLTFNLGFTITDNFYTTFGNRADGSPREVFVSARFVFVLVSWCFGMDLLGIFGGFGGAVRRANLSPTSPPS